MKELIHLIVKEIFGEDFANLCIMIYNRGRIDLKSLMNETKKSFSQIKEMLIILIKNHFVSFSIPNPDNLAEPMENAEYYLCVDTIMHTLRFIFLLNEIKNKKECLYLLIQ